MGEKEKLTSTAIGGQTQDGGMVKWLQGHRVKSRGETEGEKVQMRQWKGHVSLLRDRFGEAEARRERKWIKKRTEAVGVGCLVCEGKKLAC